MKMRKGGFLVYKCRRCGELVKNSHAPDVDMAVTLVVIGSEMPSDWGGITPHMIEAHACKDGNIGVTDLIGGEADK
jgi:hypothetical protein